VSLLLCKSSAKAVAGCLAALCDLPMDLHSWQITMTLASSPRWPRHERTVEGKHKSPHSTLQYVKLQQCTRKQKNDSVLCLWDTAVGQEAVEVPLIHSLLTDALLMT
jgi:hypothetical protein